MIVRGIDEDNNNYRLYRIVRDRGIDNNNYAIYIIIIHTYIYYIHIYRPFVFFETKRPIEELMSKLLRIRILRTSDKDQMTVEHQNGVNLPFWRISRYFHLFWRILRSEINK